MTEFPNEFPAEDAPEAYRGLFEAVKVAKTSLQANPDRVIPIDEQQDLERQLAEASGWRTELGYTLEAASHAVLGFAKKGDDFEGAIDHLDMAIALHREASELFSDQRFDHLKGATLISTMKGKLQLTDGDSAAGEATMREAIEIAAPVDSQRDRELFLLLTAAFSELATSQIRRGAEDEVNETQELALQFDIGLHRGKLVVFPFNPN